VRPGLAAFACTVLCALAAPGSALADGKDKPTPWSTGVSATKQKAALKIFQVGNKYFEASKYTDAAAEYEKALKLWDHPNIRFNLVICLIHMRQPLVAWDHLQAAMRFGEAPLGKRLYADAQTYVALLDESLADLTVEATQPDVVVMLDGEQLLIGPKSITLRVLAGTHQLVATKDGFTTDSRALNLPAGEPSTVAIELVPERTKVVEERVNYERRWRWWVPWTVAGAGIAVGLGGLGVYLSARADMKKYDRLLAEDCPVGCTDDQISPGLQSLERSASRRGKIAIGMWIGGGAVALTAGVMAILNRPRKMEERRVTPTVTVSPDYVGAGLSLSFE
jgi:hypothetical protein